MIESIDNLQVPELHFDAVLSDWVTELAECKAIVNR
jgi:hypothetical protein